MTDLVTYVLADGVATITLDDGRVNALSPEMIEAIATALDRAQEDEAIVVLTGRATTFSAGFDLRCPPERFAEMIAAGARLAEQLLAFPNPTVAACNGNAIAMGAFLLLAADVRIGIDGPFRLGLNEVAIGLTIPWFGIALARHRLTAPAFDRCTVTGVLLGPGEAREAGFLDEVVEFDELATRVMATTQALAGITRAAHTATKLRAREQVLAGVRDGVTRITDGSGREW